MILTRTELLYLLEKAGIEAMEIDISITEHHTEERQGFYTDRQKGYADAMIIDKIKDKLELTLKADINELTAFNRFERG